MNDFLLFTFFLVKCYITKKNSVDTFNLTIGVTEPPKRKVECAALNQEGLLYCT